MTSPATPELPPLPNCEHRAYEANYSADQMRAYARAAILADRERHSQPVARVGVGPFSHHGGYRFEMIDGQSLPDGVHDLYTVPQSIEAKTADRDAVTVNLMRLFRLDKREARQVADFIHGLGEVDQDARDAKRYRSLRNHRGQEHDWFIVTDTATDETLWGADLDHRIDEFHASSTGESK